MKAQRFLRIAMLSAVMVSALIIGCKYNVSEPMWDQPFTAPPAPKISQITPLEATAGVNTINIQGENFIVGTGTTLVYFDQTQAEVVSSSANSIVVRRPNIMSDSSTIKIIPHDAIEEAIYKPYKVASVLEKYGSFLQNVPLGAIAVDNSGNIYVIETISRAIHKVTPDGNNTVIGTASRSPFDGKIGPDGNLYLTENNRAVDKVDLTTGTVSRWTQLPSGKVVKFCDFGSNGFFYSGGIRTDLVITPFDLSSSSVSSGFYASSEIMAMRVFNGYIYIACKDFGSLAPAKIYKHQINQDGTVGNQVLVFDLNSIPDSAVVSGLAFSSDGIMYVSTNSAESPLIVVNTSSNSSDIFYKDILRPYCSNICWSTSNYLYMINGNTAAGEEWTVYKVDMGTNGTPYY